MEVPAGKFKCLKVLLPMPISQTFWFSDDEHRYPVKMDANGVVMPLGEDRTPQAGRNQEILRR